MATDLTATIDGGYSSPAVINVHFLDDGSGTGWENQGTLTDATGHSLGYDGWTPYEQQQAELAFAQFSAVANVVFNIVADVADADFVMASGNTEEVGGPAYWNVGGGTITVNGVDHVVDGVGVFNWEGRGWDFFGSPGGLDQGGFGFVTLVDAIALGLGLAHPHDTGVGSTVMHGVTSPTGDYGDFGLNQGVYTTMSLNEGWHTAPHGTSPSDWWGWQTGPMALDIAVLQERYGANIATNLGDTVYDMPGTSTGAGYQAIWDAGGTDTIRYGGIGHAVIDLRSATLQYEAGGGGFVSHVPGIHGGFTIAHGVTIENATGGAGNDMLIGNAAGNVLTGGLGADELNGGTGSDTASYHTAMQGVVADLSAPSNNTGDATGDIYISIESLEGSSFDDRLSGDAGANTFIAGAGDDVIHGGPGGDRLDGGTGNDTASYSHAAAAVLVDLGNAAGNQGEAAGDSYVSIENVEGSSFGDHISGDGGNNVLRGGAGNDTLHGGPGGDVLDGGNGHDWASYRFAAAGVVADLGNAAGNAGEAAGDSYAGIESLEGSSFDDWLSANAGDNKLLGDAGNDSLYGGPGGDILDGGAGTDTASYRFAAAGVVADLGNAASNAGEAGGDSYTGIENLAGSSFSDVLVGNDGANLLVGGDGADQLLGKGADDVLRGGTGDDKLFGGLGQDRLFGGPGDDVLRGGGDHDTLRGNGGQDVLFGSGGNDDLRGGGDDDILRGNSGEDRLFGGHGSDDLRGGGDADSLFGGAGGDVMFGGGGDDKLRGHGGDDVLIGGGGNDDLRGNGDNDALRGGAGDDALFGGGGDDDLRGNRDDDALRGNSGDDRLFGGGGNDDLRGNAGDDILRGNAGKDRLFGGGGDDDLRGGGGNDVLLGNAGTDTLVGGAGNDRLVGGVGNDRLIGDAGADRFVFQPNGGDDLVADFQNDLDRLDFRAFDFADAAGVLDLASQAGADVVFALPGGATVELANFDINLLGAEDILI